MNRQYSIHINKGHDMFQMCDDYCKNSVLIHNRVLFFFKKIKRETGQFPTFKVIYNTIKNERIDYDNMDSRRLFEIFGHRTIANQVLRQSFGLIVYYFRASKEYDKNPSKFLGRPKFPKYKNKETGRNIVKFNHSYKADGKTDPSSSMALSSTTGKLHLRGNFKHRLSIPKYLRNKTFRYNQMSIIPHGTCYKIIVGYETHTEKKKLDTNNYASIDFGIDNLMSVSGNQLNPVLISGKKIKSINQHYNKTVSKLQSQLPHGRYTSKKILSVTAKRNNRINNEIHLNCKWLIGLLLKENVGNLVVGYNAGWKHKIGMSNKNNQKFVGIPFAKILQNLAYRCEDVGIRMLEQEESYTSKASFIDLDKMPIFGKNNVKPQFSGNRLHRGLYISKSGVKINADINGSLNILRKCNDKLFDSKSVKACVKKPVIRLRINKTMMNRITN